jgi:hypothetical protein
MKVLGFQRKEKLSLIIIKEEKNKKKPLINYKKK